MITDVEITKLFNDKVKLENQSSFDADRPASILHDTVYKIAKFDASMVKNRQEIGKFFENNVEFKNDKSIVQNFAEIGVLDKQANTEQQNLHHNTNMLERTADSAIDDHWLVQNALKIEKIKARVL